MSASGKDKCGWIRPSRLHPKGKQRRALEAVGVGVIYEESEHETLDDMIRSRRLGDTVYVTSLSRLARTKDGILRAIDRLRERGCVIEETTTGRRSDRLEDCPGMVMDATSELAQDLRALPSELAKKVGRLGGIARGKNKRASRTPMKEAEAIWRGHPDKTNTEVVNMLKGWSERALYREFGSRSRAAGRPRKGKS